MIRFTQADLRGRLEAPLLALTPLPATAATATPPAADDEHDNAAATTDTSGQVPRDTPRPSATGASGHVPENPLRPASAYPSGQVHGNIPRGASAASEPRPTVDRPADVPPRPPAPASTAAQPAGPAAQPAAASPSFVLPPDGPQSAAPGYLLDESWSGAPASPRPDAVRAPASPPAVSQHSSSASGAPASSPAPSATPHDDPPRAPIAVERVQKDSHQLRTYGQFRKGLVDRLLRSVVTTELPAVDTPAAGSANPTSDYDVTVSGDHAGRVVGRFNEEFAAEATRGPTGPDADATGTSGHVSPDTETDPAVEPPVSPVPSTPGAASVAPPRPIPLVRERPARQPAWTGPVLEAPFLPPQRVAAVVPPPESRFVQVQPPAPDLAPASPPDAPVPVRLRSRDPLPSRHTLQFVPDRAPDHVPSDMSYDATLLAATDTSPPPSLPADLPPPSSRQASVELPPPPRADAADVSPRAQDRLADLPLPPPRAPSVAPDDVLPARPPAPQRRSALVEHASVPAPEVSRPEPPPVAAPAPALDPVALEDVLADILRAAARRQGVEV
jgi:hypothetical protein